MGTVQLLLVVFIVATTLHGDKCKATAGYRYPYGELEDSDEDSVDYDPPVEPPTTTPLPSTPLTSDSISETPPLIYDVTTIYRLEEPLPSTTSSRGVNVEGALNHPGTVEVHARTNARGLPFRLKDGTIRGPEVGVAVPECSQEVHNCRWTPKNFTTTNLFTNNIPLLKYDARENFKYVLKASVYTHVRTFQSPLRFTFDTTFAASGCGGKCYLAVFLIDEYGNVGSDDMYYLRIRHESESAAFLIKCTPSTFDNNYYMPGGATRRCVKLQEKQLAWNFTPGTLLSFTVSVNNGRIVLMVSRSQEQITLFDWIDSDPIEVSNVVFATDRIEGIVRTIDEYPVLELKEETGTILSPALPPELDKLCVSLVFYTNQGANLELQLQRDRSLSTVWELKSEQQRNTMQEGVWTHKNIVVDIVSGSSSEVTAVVRATKATGRAGSTVLIQRVAGCNAIEPEDVLVLSEEKSLRVESPGVDVAHNLVYKEFTELDTCSNGGLSIEHKYNLTNQVASCICPAGFTGDNCEKACGANSYGEDCEGVCSESERECRGMILCRPHIGCDCAPGFKDLHCITPCEKGEYGAGCRQTCGKCAGGSCDIYTGVCHQGCIDGHYPPFCKDVYTYAPQAPQVLVNSFNNVSVSANLVQLHGKGEPKYYLVQYKEENASVWQLKVPQPMPMQNTVRLTSFSLSRDIRSIGQVTDLKPGTPYMLRVVLIDKSGAIYQGDRVLSASFSTPCTVPNKADYLLYNKNLQFLDIIAVNDDGFWTSWQFPNGKTTWCPAIGYEVHVKMGWQWKVHKVPADVASLQIQHLLPGRKYNVKVRAVTSQGMAAFSETRVVTTLDKAPDHVVDLKEGEVTAHSLTITWSPPKHPAGTLRRYRVKYRCLRLMGCPQEDCSSSAGDIEVMSPSALLDGLLPHAMYSISVAGVSGTLGPESSMVTSTIPSVPEVTPLLGRPAVLSRSNSSLTVQWTSPASCRQLNGYFRGYRYELVTPEQQLPLLVGTTTNFSASFDNLKPHTDYVVRVFVDSSAGWNKAYGLEIASKTRETRSEVVKNLAVYKRGRRLIGLRWSLPSMSHGLLQSYTITHRPINGSGKPISVTVKPRLCPAWNHLYCHTIGNLKPDTEYNIAVRTRNLQSAKSTEEGSEDAVTVTTNLVQDEDVVIYDHDILQAVKIPFDDPKTQSFENGFEGFPAFSLKPGSDVKSPYRLFLPEKLYGEFSIYATIRTISRESAFLFSVVNPLETVVQLGVQISPAGVHQPNNMNISLLYTDVNSHFASQTVASFTVPSFVKKWTRFALKVTEDYVTLFFNCQEFGKVAVTRSPQELVFHSSSTLYVGQAGELVKGAFDGAIQELKLFGSAAVAHVQCDKKDFKDEKENIEDGEEVTVIATTKEGAPEPPSYLRIKNQTDATLAFEWGLPDLINGHLRSFLVNIEETDSVNSSDCCSYFPLREVIVMSEESGYEYQMTGLKPASSYEVSVSAKTVAMGPALTLTAHTRPPTPVLTRVPRLAEPIIAGSPLVVLIEPATQYQDQLISGYLLLLEDDTQSDNPPSIHNEWLLSELKLAPNKSFSLVAEFTQSELPAGRKVEFYPGRSKESGRFGPMGLPALKPGSQYRLIWALVLDYCGTKSVGKIAGVTFTVAQS